MWGGRAGEEHPDQVCAKILRPGGISTLFSPEPQGCLRQVLMPEEEGEDMGKLERKGGEKRKEGAGGLCRWIRAPRTTVDQRIGLLVPELK